MTKILVVFTRHGKQRYSDALDTLEAYYANALPSIEPEILIVDNTLPSGFMDVNGKTTLIGDSSQFWEFSSWDVGIAHVGAKLLAYDFIHFVTSAYNQLYVAYIAKMTEECLDAVRNKDFILGHIDCYDEPVRFFGRASQYWIRSSFFFMRPETVLRLGSFVSVHPSPELYSGDFRSPFADQAPIDQRFQKYIIDWLTGEGTGQGTQWHSRFELTDETLPYFEAKALTLLNEHALTMRLAQQGSAVIDATFLDYILRHHHSQNLPYLYDWHQQLIARKNDL